jgi:hypothetical protein
MAASFPPSSSSLGCHAFELISLCILGSGHVELAAGRPVAVVRKRARASWWEVHELDPWQWSPRRLHHRFLLCADCDSFTFWS